MGWTLSRLRVLTMFAPGPSMRDRGLSGGCPWTLGDTGLCTSEGLYRIAPLVPLRTALLKWKSLIVIQMITSFRFEIDVIFKVDFNWFREIQLQTSDKQQKFLSVLYSKVFSI